MGFFGVLGSLEPLPFAGNQVALFASMKSAVFLERDGVLNLCETRGQTQVQPLRFEQFKINDEALPLVRQLKDAGLIVIVATNQPAVSREIGRAHV